MSHNILAELGSLVFIAVALGMDAFSVSLVLGMQKIRLRRIAIIGIVIGIFHMIMPLIGMNIGKIFSMQLGHLTSLVSGLLLFGIGSHMFFSAFNYERKTLFQTHGFGLLLLAVTISLDSLSVGISYGISGIRSIVVILLFGIASTILTWIGMLLGRNISGLLGAYSELLGGSILCGIGLQTVFG